MTAVAGGKDVLLDPIVETGGADFFAFSDRPLPDLKVWKVRPLPLWSSDPKYAPRRNAKIPKILPELLLPDYDYFIWIDGNVELRMRPDDLCRQLLDEQGAEFAALPHRLRGCVYEEARAVLQFRLDHRALVKAQMREYRRQGHPSGAGLSELMFIVRRNTAACRQLGLSWLEQVSRFSSRDQLSFPIALRSTPVAFAPIDPGNCLDNPYFKLRRHEVAHGVPPWSWRLRKWLLRLGGKARRRLQSRLDRCDKISMEVPTDSSAASSSADGAGSSGREMDPAARPGASRSVTVGCGDSTSR